MATPEQIFAENQRLTALFKPQMDAEQAARDALWATQRNNMLEKYGPAAVARGYNTSGEYAAVRKQEGRSDFLKRVILPVAAFATGGAALAAGGLGGAGAATSAIGPGATTAAKAGLAARLGSIFSNPGFEVGTNAALALFGQHQQNKANTQARKDALATQAKQIELEQQRLAQEAQNANLDREDARALNAAIQDLEKKKFAIAQEQAEFERSNVLYDRGKYEQEQARLAPYRQISEQALRRLSSMWGLG